MFLMQKNTVISDIGLGGLRKKKSVGYNIQK